MTGALEAACGDVLSTPSFSYLSGSCITLGHSRSFSIQATTTMHHLQGHHTEQIRKRIILEEHSIFN